MAGKSGMRFPRRVLLIAVLASSWIAIGAQDATSAAAAPANASAAPVTTGAQPAAQPAVQPAAQPAAQPVTQPVTQPANQSAVQPAAQPAEQPAAAPANATAEPAAQPTTAQPATPTAGTAGTTTTTAAAAPATDSSTAVPASVPEAAKAQPNAKEVRTIEVAPAAMVSNDDDISDTGSCKADIESLCKDVESGEGRIADCLAQQSLQVDDSESKAPQVSEECREEVMQYKIKRNSNINMNLPLAKACMEDVRKHCNITSVIGYTNGSVIACLRDKDRQDQLKPACKKELFKVQLDASFDYRADPILREACEKDAATLCKDVKHGGGRIQQCLREQRMNIGWDCEEQLFRKEKEDADDIRLSVRLFNKCLPDKQQFCGDVPPGNAHAKSCLESHLQELSGPCRAEMDSMIERRVQDFNLDSRLRKVCSSVIYTTCAYLGDLDDMDTSDAHVINCLQDYASEIRDEECRSHVKHYLELAAQDIRFDVPLADACQTDRKTLCANVPPGSARVIRCLQNNRDKLAVRCRAVLFDEEVRFSENIDFQYPMKQACEKEMSVFCKGVPHGNARMIRCLQDNKASANFGKACAEEVQRYEQTAAQDYRLNHRLYNTCKSDVAALCKDACKLQEGQVCGGKVLQCLTENKASIKSPDCSKEVFNFERMEVQDFRNDIALAESCKADADKHCANVKPGEGRMHKCLREHSKELSEACRRAELKLEAKESEDIRFSAGLLRACRDERSLFCRGVEPGQARVFRCLAENMGSGDFGDVCRSQIKQKIERRQSNWRLDPPLRKACKEDVAQFCSTEDGARSETASVKKCLVAKAQDISAGCRRELGRSVHMALFMWQPQGVLTSVCDDDIKAHCLKSDSAMDQTPGAIGSCLASIYERMSEASEGNTTISTAARRRLLADGPAAAAGGATKHEQKPASTNKGDDAAAAGKLAVAAEDAKKKEKAKVALAAAAKDKERVAEEGRERKKASDPKEQAKLARQKLVAAAAAAVAAASSSATPAGVKLSDACAALTAVAQPPDVQRKFDQSLGYAVLANQMAKVEESTGMPVLQRNRQGGITGISLTGWSALAGMAALVLVVIAAGVYGVRRFATRERQGYARVSRAEPGLGA